MVLQVSLLDYLLYHIRFTQLSDLHALNDVERVQLIGIIEKIPPREASLWEWNDALVYLVQGAPEQTEQSAKLRLIELLIQQGRRTEGAQRGSAAEEG